MESLIASLNGVGEIPVNAEVVVAVPSLFLRHCREHLRPDIHTSSQDIGLNSGFGAYTGEISDALLLDSGIHWCLAGHSERRVGFGYPGETSEVVGRKVKVAVKAGINVIACIGELLADRDSGRTMDVCSEQLQAIAAAITHEEWSKVVIAYEPVWAIGTGKVATPAQAEETHMHIRQWISTNVSPSVASAVRIIYGGSVKGNNCVSLIQCPNIDGFLVGGASLLPEFADIIRSASHKI